MDKRAGPLPPGVPSRRDHSHRGSQTTIQQRTHAKHARNTDNTAGPPHRNTQQLNAITNHRSKFKKLQLLIGTGARRDGGREGYPQISPPDPSHRGIISRTQLRSLARTHATQTQAQSKSISRFGGSANAALTPPTSDPTSTTYLFQPTISTYLRNPPL